MSKEYLEALEKVRYNSSLEVVKCFDILQQALQRLEAIDNANPSEALECLEEMWELSCDSRKPEYTLYDTIKQALLKAQEQEKENELLKEIIKRY